MPPMLGRGMVRLVSSCFGADQRELAVAPDVWSDGSLVVDKTSGVGVAGCGVYAHASGAAWF